MQEIGPLASSDPAAAEARLAGAKAFLDGLKEKADDAADAGIDRALQGFAGLERSLTSEKRRAERVGQPAAPLAVEAWANGEPISQEDLKGKVVLLDFWAVWCGPCIATFPHLRDWNKEYADDGLVILGLTRYYNYRWDDQAGRAVRSDETVAPEQERAMLEKFADQNDLGHRFAIQDGSAMSDFYGVTGIPQAVVIDREGIVRLIRVGSGEQNAADIDKMLKQLLGTPAAGE